MNLIIDWSQVPEGFHLVRMFHERTGQYCLHLHLKTHPGPWYDQPRVPQAYSEAASASSHPDFWSWAQEHLPVWDYPDPVKSCE